MYQVKFNTFAMETLGCRLNSFESDGIGNILLKNGFQIAKLNEIPEFVIINTCTVTNKADAKSRHVIRNTIKKYPTSKIYVTGCYAQTDKDIVEKIPGVHCVVGNDKKSELPFKILKQQSIINEKKLDRFSYPDVLPINHTRAYLKIQDGCDRKCSYCKIPEARGRSSSRDYNDILDQVRYLQDNGIGEIILTGINIGWFKDRFGKKSFIKLLKDILSILYYSRLRISSIEPSDVGVELGELFSHSRLASFLHCPLQSGSKNILKKMRRSYTPYSFLKRIESVKKANPNIFLGTDLIVGFPFEEDNDFQESLKLIQDLEFAKIHFFPFSVRKNTTAANFQNFVDKEKKKSRCISGQKLSKRLYEAYARKQINQIQEAILEADNNCLTDNYLKIKLPKEEYKNLEVGQFLNIKIVNVENYKIEGSIQYK